jgi:hypothetical protein
MLQGCFLGAKKHLFWLKRGFLGLKNEYKSWFVVTYQLTGKNYKLFIMCQLQEVGVKKRSQKHRGGWGVPLNLSPEEPGEWLFGFSSPFQLCAEMG